MRRRTGRVWFNLSREIRNQIYFRESVCTSCFRPQGTVVWPRDLVETRGGADLFCPQNVRLKGRTYSNPETATGNLESTGQVVTALASHRPTHCRCFSLTSEEQNSWPTR